MKTNLILCFSLMILSNNLSSEDLKEMLNREGPQLICGSKDYIQCLPVSEETCIEQVGPISPRCIEFVFSSRSPFQNEEDQANGYVLCINLDHYLAFFEKELPEIRACNSANKTSTDAIAEIIMKAKGNN